MKRSLFLFAFLACLCAVSAVPEGYVLAASETINLVGEPNYGSNPQFVTFGMTFSAGHKYYYTLDLSSGDSDPVYERPAYYL